MINLILANLRYRGMVAFIIICIAAFIYVAYELYQAGEYWDLKQKEFDEHNSIF